MAREDFGDSPHPICFGFESSFSLRASLVRAGATVEFYGSDFRTADPRAHTLVTRRFRLKLSRSAFRNLSGATRRSTPRANPGSRPSRHRMLRRTRIETERTPVFSAHHYEKDYCHKSASVTSLTRNSGWIAIVLIRFKD
jgi:hypothetical protein